MQKKQILDLTKYIDQEILVKFQGGRVVQGTLKGFDPLQNLVLDGTVELVRDLNDEYKLLDKSRKLGLVVSRGPAVSAIYPVKGSESIDNPF
jgi:U6 snRNA-associated Sm-like protein LSm7